MAWILFYSWGELGDKNLAVTFFVGHKPELDFIVCKQKPQGFESKLWTLIFLMWSVT